jgi:ubiquinone/menaquinone biosynthesis C-methylase UbiE
MSLPRRFVKFAFHLLYHQLAFTYDIVAWLVSFGQWQVWGKTAIDRVRGQRVLELGHGPGHLLIAVARSGRSPIGIDLSPDMIRIARRRIRRERLDIPQVRCRAQALPFRSNVFDSVVAAFPTDYIVDLATLREVRRVTTGHGRLVVVMGTQLGRHGPGAHFVEWLYRITGQRESAGEKEESVFDRAGLPARIETETIGASTVTIIVADKAATEDEK